MSRPRKESGQSAIQVVSSNQARVIELVTPPETTAQRIQRLQNEARGLAVQEIHRLEKALNETAAMSAEIAAGGDAYHVGVRELASRIAEDLFSKAETIRILASRSITAA